MWQNADICESIIIFSGMYSVPRALRDLWEKCENGDRTTIGRNTNTPWKKYSNIWSKVIEGTVATIGNGINTYIC